MENHEDKAAEQTQGAATASTTDRPLPELFYILDGRTQILHAINEQDAKDAAIRWARGGIGRQVTVAKVICQYESGASVVERAL